jgi:hypothetical protein
MGLDELVPTVLIRGGRPATPTLQLTPRGWLQSARRGDVATMVTVFLATYRSMATAGQLHGRRISWSDLQNNGAADALRGVLNTAGRQFHLFAGAALVPPTAAPDQIGLELPWDVDELIHIENADRFFDYRLANPVERVNFFQRLRLRVTGDLKSVIDLVYGANIPGWPLQRRIEVSLGSNSRLLASASRAGLVRVLGSDRLDARVSLTYEGLWLAQHAEVERDLIVKALRELARAFTRSPMRDCIPCAELIGHSKLTEQEVEQVLPLLIGQEPQVVFTDEKSRPSRDLHVGSWLLDLCKLTDFDDLVYTLGRARDAEIMQSMLGEAASAEDGPVKMFNDDPIRELGEGKTSSIGSSKRLVALKRAIEATFNQDKWLELGALMGELDFVQNDPRLLRSLHFGDVDYGARCLIVLSHILGDDEQRFASAAGFAGLESWLAENEPALHSEIYGANVPSSPTLRTKDLGDEIGTGGYGRVFRYHDPRLDHAFAVKLLDPTPLADAGDVAVKRFFREAGILLRLNHPGIVRIYDANWIDGKPYIKMELIEGRNLNQFMMNQGAQFPSKALDIIEQILGALVHAHGVGVVHRDLKPSNVMLRDDGSVRIIDFGMGIYIEHDLETRYTKTGHAATATYYTAPELAERPKLIDPRTDLYSVGAIWFTLLVNRPPAGAGIEVTLRELPDIGEEYVSAVVMALSPLDKRYSTAKMMLEDVRALRK